MSLVAPTVYDGAIQRRFRRGDILMTGDIMPATISTATNLTITAAMLANGIILRNPAGVCNENIDTAANLVAGFMAGLGLTGGIEPGSCFRVRWICTTANVLTVVCAANTGLIGTRLTINASSSKDFLITFVNGTPRKDCVNILGTSGSAVLSGFSDADIAALTPGMIVLNAVANLQGQTILGVNMAARTVTMSGNANATGLIAPQFSPVVSVDGIGNLLS